MSKNKKILTTFKSSVENTEKIKNFNSMLKKLNKCKLAQ
jgi:hypothetical protein